MVGVRWNKQVLIYVVGVDTRFGRGVIRVVDVDAFALADLVALETPSNVVCQTLDKPPV